MGFPRQLIHRPVHSDLMPRIGMRFHPSAGLIRSREIHSKQLLHSLARSVGTGRAASVQRSCACSSSAHDSTSILLRFAAKSRAAVWPRKASIVR